MRAVIVCAAAPAPLAELTQGAPTALLPLVDRPFLQHMMEQLAERGIRQVDLILSERADLVERVVGDGRRWGLNVSVHLARDPYRPYRMIPPLDPGNSVLLGHADRLPAGASLADMGGAGGAPHLVVNPEGEWTGWARVTAEHLARLPGDLDEAGLGAHLASLPGATRHTCHGLLDATSAARLLNGQRQVLEGAIRDTRPHARRIAPGVWAARGASIDPKAVLMGPVFIGELAEVGPGVRIGPNTVIGAGSVVGAGSTLSNCLLSPNSYVGDTLELENVLVAGNRLLNLDLATVLRVPDRDLLAPLTGDGLRPVGWLSRLAAAAALVLAVPVIAATALALWLVRGQVRHRRLVLATPVARGQTPVATTLVTFDDPRSPPKTVWSHLILRVLPGLRHVAAGHLGVVGVEPRSLEEMQQVPAGWNELIGQVRSGLITEGLVMHGPAAVPTDRALADAWYAAHSSRRYDLRLLRSYVARLFRGQPVPIIVRQS